MATTLPPSAHLKDNRGPVINRVTAIVGALGTLAVIGRLISRKLKKSSFDASDYTIILGLVFGWGEAICIFIAISCGLGRHSEIVPLTNLTKISQTSFASEIIYSICLPLIKVSILLLYRSIFPTRGFAIATNVVGAIVVAWGIACLLVSIFSCVPIHGFWDLTVPSKCINTREFFLGNAIPNITMDVIILALPMGKIWYLQMSKGRKFAVSGIFLLGGFVCVASGIRLWSLLAMNLEDLTWSYFGVSIWTAIEINAAITCACLPTLRPALQYTLPKLISLISSSLSSSRLRRDVERSESKDTFVLTPKNTTGVFQRLPGPPVDNQWPLKLVKAKLGHTETASSEVDVERGNLIDERNDIGPCGLR